MGYFVEMRDELRDLPDQLKQKTWKKAQGLFDKATISGMSGLLENVQDKWISRVVLVSGVNLEAGIGDDSDIAELEKAVKEHNSALESLIDKANKVADDKDNHTKGAREAAREIAVHAGRHLVNMGKFRKEMNHVTQLLVANRTWFQTYGVAVQFADCIETISDGIKTLDPDKLLKASTEIATWAGAQTTIEAFDKSWRKQVKNQKDFLPHLEEFKKIIEKNFSNLETADILRESGAIYEKIKEYVSKYDKPQPWNDDEYYIGSGPRFSEKDFVRDVTGNVAGFVEDLRDHKKSLDEATGKLKKLVAALKEPAKLRGYSKPPTGRVD